MKPRVPDRNTAMIAGLALVVAGSWLIYDAYEARGRTRPWLVRLLPGV